MTSLTEAAHRRYWPYWEVYFLVVAAAVAAATLAADGHALWRREVVVAAIAGMAVLHVTVSRRLIGADIEDWRNLVAALVTLVLFVVAVAAAPFATWLLFALIPLFFQLVPMRPAIVLVVLVNLVTPLVDVFEEPKLVPMDLVIGAISAAAGVWLGFWNIRVIEQSVERGQLIEELEESRAEVARLSHEAGVAAERTRLAGEIHDTLAQGFTSIITLLQAADPQLRDERVALAVRTAKENLAEARALVSDLSPVALASGSLLDSVRRAASRFSEESGVPATVRITGADRPLPTSVEVVLLRSTQEALTNVRRHAGAGSAQVLLAFGDEGVRLTVRDDGRGFTPGSRSSAAGGFGLNGMRARAEQVNGTLTVASTPADGTTIELEIPA
ncbi:sensor histidine kinase [Actinoplanes sp. NPDC051343]|uniref:sensor histidine kinase n=1 Tax=Actinoplanes sp. NPDC051343 TaxID=3363906 RepID=UPI003789DDE5